MHVSSEPDAGCKTCLSGYVRVEGVVSRILSDSRVLQGAAKKNFVCSVQNCKVMHMSTEPSTGCKECNAGFNRIEGKVTRLLESGDRILQGTPKPNFICQATAPTPTNPIANCKVLHLAGETESGCKECNLGFGRKEGTAPKLRMLDEDRVLQTTTKYFVCEKCTQANCRDCGTIINTSCKECNSGFFIGSARLLEFEERVLQTTTQVCKACSPGCATCNNEKNDQCRSCQERFFKVGGLAEDKPGSCAACIPNCLT